MRKAARTPRSLRARVGAGLVLFVLLGAGAFQLWPGAGESQNPLNREVTVRFETDASSTGWQFHPRAPQMALKLGQTGLAFFDVANPGSVRAAGAASYRVTPAAAERYLVRVACFCSQTQVLAAGEHAEVPMAFYVDPALARDPALKGLHEITLSYSFTQTAIPAEGAGAVPAKAKFTAGTPPDKTNGRDIADEGT